MSLISYYTTQSVDTNVNSFTSSFTSNATKSTQITDSRGGEVETRKTSIIEKETRKATYVPHPFFYTQLTSIEVESRYTFPDGSATTFTASELFSENETMHSHEAKFGEFQDQINDKTILDEDDFASPQTTNVVSSVDYTGTLQSLTTLEQSPNKIYTTREIPRVQIVNGEEVTRNEVHITTKQGVAGDPNGSIWTLTNGEETIEDADKRPQREVDENGLERFMRTRYQATTTAQGIEVSQTAEHTIGGSAEQVLVYRNCPTVAGQKTLYDDVWMWTKLTTDGSYTATWHERKNENPPTEFSLLRGNAYSVTEPLPVSDVQTSKKTIENSFSVEYESEQETKKNYAFQTGERAQTNINGVPRDYDDGEDLAEFDTEGNQHTQNTNEEGQSITSVWAYPDHFDMFTEDAKLFTFSQEGVVTETSSNGQIMERFTALDADGGYIVVDEEKAWHSTLTINYSTLIPQYSPWASSNSVFTPDTEDPLGGPIFRDEGQTIPVTEVEDTIRESRVEQLKTGENDTDYNTITEEELTTGRLAYQSQIGDTTCEGNPRFNKIVGTTKTAVLGLPLAESNKFSIIQTDKGIRYLLPKAIPTTYTISDQEVESTIYSFTATRSISPEEHLELSPNIVGYESTVLQPEPDDEDARPTTTRTEVTSKQSMWYARLAGTIKNDNPNFISGEMGDDTLKLHYNDSATYPLTLYGQPFLNAVTFESEFANTNSKTGQEFFQTEDNSVDGRSETKSYGSDSQNTEDNLTSKYGKKEEKSTSVKFQNFHQQLKVYFNSLMIHTKMSGKGGFVYAEELSGNSSGWQTYETFSNVSGYKGIAGTDFEEFEHGLHLTTQYLSLDNVKWVDDGVNLRVVRTIEETREETYSEATTGTIRLSDELQNMYDTFGDPPNYDGDNGQYVEVILSDACGNTTQYGMDSVDGEAPDSEGDPFYDDIYGDDYDGGGGGYGYDYNNAYDEYGNYVDPYADGGTPFTPEDGGGGDDYYGDPVDPVDDRDPSCGEFTFTYNDTTHLPHMTSKVTVTEGQIDEITPLEQFPYFYTPLFFYGNKEMLTLNSYDELPQRNWFHEGNSDGSVYNFRYWTFYNENRFGFEKSNLSDLVETYPFGGMGYHAPFNEGRDRVAGQIIRNELFPIYEYQSIGGDPQGFEMFNQGYAHTAFCQTAYSHLDSIRIFQGVDNFQYNNTIYEPFYKVTNVGFSNARTITDIDRSAYEITSGYRDFRRNNEVLIRRTKKFTEGAWGYIIGEDSKTTNLHISLEGDRALQDHFSYDSEFYKEFLEQTSYTLTSSKDNQSNKDWYYKSASRSVSELIAGLDGKYQPVYESGTSGTFPFQATFETAGYECETHLSGSFYGFDYKQVNEGAITIRAKYKGGHCCPCHQSSSLQIEDQNNSYAWGAISQLENVIVNGNDNMSVAINPCATMWTENQNILVPIPITTATKDLEENGVWEKGTYSETDMLVIDLYRKAFSCEVPKMLIMGQWGVGDGRTGKYFIVPFVYSRPNEELQISSARGHVEFTNPDHFDNRHTCNQPQRYRGIQLANKLDIFRSKNLNPNH